VERALRDAMQRDRARTKILRTSPFGLIEMTRQRIRPSLKRSVYRDCVCCAGTGVVKTAESMAIEAVRLLILACHQPDLAKVTISVGEEVAAYLNNRKRRELTRLEDESKIAIQVLSREGASPEYLVIECQDANGRDLKFSTS
jgi:ribonuclease E